MFLFTFSAAHMQYTNTYHNGQGGSPSVTGLERIQLVTGSACYHGSLPLCVCLSLVSVWMLFCLFWVCVACTAYNGWKEFKWLRFFVFGDTRSCSLHCWITTLHSCFKMYMYLYMCYQNCKYWHILLNLFVYMTSTVHLSFPNFCPCFLSGVFFFSQGLWREGVICCTDKENCNL